LFGGLNLFDATMAVIGAMIGSGIFIVSADMSRMIGSPGWMLAAWVFAGVLTVTAALSYGELASMLPQFGVRGMTDGFVWKYCVKLAVPE
jgi:APA family basic amino acid/polyamine antiporter